MVDHCLMGVLCPAKAGYSRVVRDLVSGDIPVGDEGVVCVIKRGVIGHLNGASVGVFALSEELIDGIEGIGLDRIVGSEYDELRDIRLRERM